MIKNILALQFSSKIADPNTNCKILYKNLEECYLKLCKNKPDFLFLPEVWNVGWLPEVFKDNSEDENSSTTVEFLKKIAIKFDINVIGGSIIRKTKKGLKNSCPIILRNGNLIGYYDKIHLYSPDGEAQSVKPGDEPLIVEIEGLKIGFSICYDIRFPELFRSYINTKNPPHLLVNMSAWPKKRAFQYKIMAASRAIENQAYFLALSQCGEIKNNIYNAGGSVFIDPMGNILKELDENCDYMYIQVDTEIVEDIRNTYPNIKNRKIFDFGFKPKEIAVEKL